VNCDQTFRAKVTEVVQTDKIRVLHNGKTYTVYSSIFCEVDDMVRVCVPCGNWQELYVIENRSKGKTLRDLYQKVGALENKFEGYLPLTGGIMVGDLSVKTLLSDLPSGATKKTNLHILPYVAHSAIDPTHDNQTYIKELLKWTCAKYRDTSGASIFLGVCNPNSAGLIMFHIYDTQDVKDGLPRYSTGFYVSLGRGIYMFSTNQYVFEMRII